VFRASFFLSFFFNNRRLFISLIVFLPRAADDGKKFFRRDLEWFDTAVISRARTLGKGEEKTIISDEM
jgi:hypothetical protein